MVQHFTYVHSPQTPNKLRILLQLQDLNLKPSKHTLEFQDSNGP